MSTSALLRVALAVVALAAWSVAAGAQTVADPVSAAKQEIERSCLKVDYPADFAQWSDLTGDGRDDVILRYDVVCDGFKNTFCNRGGCEGAVYVALPDGGYAKTDLSPTAEPITWNERPAVRVGGAVRVWDGGAFVRPTDELRLRPPQETAAEMAEENAPLTGDQEAALQRELLSRGELLASTEAMGDLAREIRRRERQEREAQERLERRRAELAREAREAEERAAAMKAAAEGGAEITFPREPRPRAEEAPAPEEEAPAEDEAAQDAEEEPPALAEGVWVFHEVDGLFAAEIQGEGGEGSMRLSCRPGDPTLALAFRPTSSGGSGLVRGAGVLLLADFYVGRYLSESRLMAYTPEGDQWRDTVSSYSPLVEDMRRGSWFEVREPGRRRALAQLPLKGSSKAIFELLNTCGL